MGADNPPYFTKREHSYAELVSSIDWQERLIDEGVREKDKVWLRKGLKNYLTEETGMDEELASKTIKKQLDEGSLKFKKLVNSAEKKGYLEDFKLNEPWHPKIFYEGEFISYPFQHDSVIVYRGMRRRFFYKSNVQEEEDRSRKHPTSVFNHQYLRPGSSLQQGDEQEFIWTTPSLEEAKGYGGVVLEIQIPIKWLVFGAKRKDEVSNLRQMHEKFGSPEKFHTYLTENWSRSGTTFKINREIPIHYVRGGWDMDKYDEPEFLPLHSENEKDLIEVMREEDGDKIPEKTSMGRNWKHSDEINKQRRKIERALQHEYKIDEKEMNDLLDKVKAGKDFTYSDYLSFFRQLKVLSDEIKEDLESIRSGERFTDKHWIQSTLFSINKVMEKMKKEFGEEHQLSEVKDGEELIEVVNRREDILENHEQELEDFESVLMEKREKLRDIYNEELIRKGQTPDKIDLNVDMTLIARMLGELNSFKLSKNFSVSAQFPSIEWLKEQISLAEKEESQIEKEIHVEDENIGEMREKYERDEIVQPEYLRKEAERLRKETIQIKKVGERIIRIERGEIDSKEAFEEIENKEIKKNFREEVKETKLLVNRFNRELERIKKETAILEKISSTQSIHPGGSITRVNVLMSQIEDNLEDIHEEDEKINDLFENV